jgi:signal transduction histidine kinase
MTLPARPSETDPLLRPKPRAAREVEVVRIAHGLALFVGLVGACALCGWIFDIDRLRRILPAQPTVTFNTGVCLTLMGLAWFVAKWLRYVCAVAVALVALSGLVEYLFRVRHGVDELFFTYPGGGAHPGRMAVVTAVSFILLAAGRVLIEIGRPRGAHVAAFVVVFIAALTLLGYAYDVSWLYRLRPISTTSTHTAGLLLMLGVATGATVPSKSLSWSLYGDDVGAVLTRRLLPVALIGLPIVGAIGLVGERHDLYDSTTTAALIVVACALIVGGVTWAAAVRLSRTDRGRTQAINELTELKIDLERQVQKRAAQLQRRRNEIAVLEDRQRIAADLHDIVIQRLFAAGMFLQGGGTLTTDPDTRSRVDAAVESMDAAIKDLRASIFELGGKREVPNDLATAVDDICVESARVLGFLPNLIVDDPRADADRVRDDILAVLREALANVARHARASEVEVVLRSCDGLVSLSVTDDGVGMTETGRSSGTRNMAERARDHGGDCTWTAVQPTGTCVHWYMPIAAVVGF